MGQKNKIICISVFLLIIIPALFFGFRILLASGEVVVDINKESYKVRNRMRVSVKNKFFGKEVCLSSCYPYFLQKGNGKWIELSYERCAHQDKVTKCIGPGGKKVFETTVPRLPVGNYRMVVPVCKDCGLGMIFKEDTRFFSESFRIK